MTLLKSLKTSLILTVILLSSSIAQASSLGFDNIIQSGNSVAIDLVISELGDNIAPSIPTYDLNINFDQNHLAFLNASFGDPVLGNQLDLLGFEFNEQVANIVSVGNLNIFELSFDTPEDLNAFQADSFTLATLTFNALNAGTSQLEITITELIDTDSNNLAVELSSISVTTVPLPAAFWFMVSGLGMLYKNKKSGKSHVI